MLHRGRNTSTPNDETANASREPLFVNGLPRVRSASKSSATLFDVTHSDGAGRVESVLTLITVLAVHGHQQQGRGVDNTLTFCYSLFTRRFEVPACRALYKCC